MTRRLSDRRPKIALGRIEVVARVVHGTAAGQGVREVRFKLERLRQVLLGLVELAEHPV